MLHTVSITTQDSLGVQLAKPRQKKRSTLQNSAPGVQDRNATGSASGSLHVQKFTKPLQQIRTVLEATAPKIAVLTEVWHHPGHYCCLRAYDLQSNTNHPYQKAQFSKTLDVKMPHTPSSTTRNTIFWHNCVQSLAKTHVQGASTFGRPQEVG